MYYYCIVELVKELRRQPTSNCLTLYSTQLVDYCLMENTLMDWLLCTVINNCWWIKLQWIVLYIASLVYDNEFHVVCDFYTSVRYTSYCACIGGMLMKKAINWQIWTLVLPGLYTGGFEGFDRTPYFCSLKLILSLHIKYCMIMCGIVCRNLHSGIFWMLKYHNFVSVWGLCPHTPVSWIAY